MNSVNAAPATALALLVLVLCGSSGCAAVEGIFKAGVGVGIFMAVVVVGLVVFLFTRVSSR
jgi:hypothetical protein